MMVDMVKSIDRMYVGTTTVRSKYVCVAVICIDRTKKMGNFCSLPLGFGDIEKFKP